ncbi:SMI1/KNR4 family protein [Flavobacterium collinsii]|uniref:SMI1/KNR4 family protein n=1 Tax=Flavobacterium collinsii TaxID=1114861 RepID=UPI00375822F2
MILQDVEKRYEFEYPPLYKQLYEDGMLDIGEYGPNWYSDVYPKLKENPPLLLHSYDFELLSLKGVSREIERLTNPDDYRQIKKEFRFIPFAKSGAGDHFCFFLNGEEDGNVPIVFVWHDNNEVNYLAKNLEDFVFRTLLSDMSQQDIYNEESEAEFKSNIEEVFKSHEKYLTEERKEVLQKLLKRDIVDYQIFVEKSKEDARGFLTDLELQKLLVENIWFDKMDVTFKYSNE